MASDIKISKVKKIHGYKFCLTMPSGKERWFTRRTMPNGRGIIYEMQGNVNGTAFMYQIVDGEDLSLDAVERNFQDYLNAGNSECAEDLIGEVKSLMHELNLQLSEEGYQLLCDDLKAAEFGEGQ